ncbi:MAG: tyrosine-type recombinase/integrase [Candidatus Acidiferrales bacterium]
MYTFRYRKDIAGVESRKQFREVLGSIKQMTKSEAERRKKEFLAKLDINSGSARIPSVSTFAHAVKHYREQFAPEMLRESTFSTADSHLKTHLEPDWNDTPVDHITIDAVNEWARKKRRDGLSWVSIKNVLRTMQRVLSAFSKDRKPPFSQQGLIIPERDRLQMQLKGRNAASFDWHDTGKIVAQLRASGLSDSAKLRYEALFLLAAASGLRCGELFALRMNDLDFEANTIRVDESVSSGTIKVGTCKNVAAYRTVLLADREGNEALGKLRTFVADRAQEPNALVFPSRQNTPLHESNVMHRVLHPALKALGLPRAGMHAFRHGCNRRWNPAVLRQQMGHSSFAMTARYTGEIPIEQVRIGPRIASCDHCDQNQF